MIPLVASVRELDIVRDEIEAVAADIERERGVSVPHKVGTMIELPRAAVTADQIAGTAEFFSFGTNDLTQMTWGFSRDDVEASFFSTYLEHGIFPVSPFESLDTEGVGALVRWRWSGAGQRGPTSTSASAVSTAATRRRSTSSTRWGSTTSPARRSGSPSPGSRPAARRAADGRSEAVRSRSRRR